MTNTEEEKVRELLFNVQLDQFYRHIQNKLHITRLSHFDHVKEEDLDDIGMAKPEQRRLFEALKKYKKKNLFSSFRRKKSKKVTKDENSVPVRPKTQYGVAGESLTCVINEKSLILHEMLGNGAFGYVRRGEWTKEPNDKVDVAVKCFKYSDDKELFKVQMDFIKEANGMTLLHHPNIIQLYGIVLSTPLKLVTELAPLGCLLHQLQAHPHNLTISILCEFILQIASGMEYLESQRFIHRDIAARNLLLESFTKVKIGDFGMMHVLSEGEDFYTMHPTGKVAFAWCAPEVLKLRQFSHASDVWAFGIMVMELFSYGEAPWPGLNGKEILDKVDVPMSERPARPDHCPTTIYTVLTEQCWAHSACERPRFSALKKTLEQVRPIDCKAIFSYDSRTPQNLSFQERDIITVIEASSEHSWWTGQNTRTRKIGIFPAELVDLGVKTDDSSSKQTLGSQILTKHVKQQRTSISKKTPSCDCGSQHVYDHPVVFSSFSTDDSADCRSNRSFSCESDFTSSTECDSGIDTSAGESRISSHSTEERTSSLSFSHGSQPWESMYELMHPVECASNPIPIPHKNDRHHDTRRARSSAIPSIRQDSGKCPLMFPCKLSPADSEDAPLNGYPSILPPSGPAPVLGNVLTLPTANSKPSRLSSSPCSSVLPPSLSTNGPHDGFSFSGGKTSPRQFGEVFMHEMMPCLRAFSPDDVKGDSEVLKTRKEPCDVYEDMVMVRASVSTSDEAASCEALSCEASPAPDIEPKQSSKNMVPSPQNTSEVYEDMVLVKANSASVEKSSSLKQRQVEQHIYENHSFGQKEGSVPRTGQLDSYYENVSPVMESKLNETDTGTSTQLAAYDNHRLKPVAEHSEVLGQAYDNHRLRRMVVPHSQFTPNYDNWKLKSPVVDQMQQLQTLQPIANSVGERTVTTASRQSYENVQRCKLDEPSKEVKNNDGPATVSLGEPSKHVNNNNIPTAASLDYENVVHVKANYSPAHKKDHVADCTRQISQSSEAAYENCSPVIHAKTSSSDSKTIPGLRIMDGSLLSHGHWPRSLPPDLCCIGMLPCDSDGSVMLMPKKRNVHLVTRRAGSMDSIFWSREQEALPIPPPRRKRISRKCQLHDMQQSATVAGTLVPSTTKKVSTNTNPALGQHNGNFMKMSEESKLSPASTETNEDRQGMVNAFERSLLISKKDTSTSLVNGLQKNGFSQINGLVLPPDIPPKFGSPGSAFHRCKSVAFPLQCRELSVDTDSVPMTRSYSEGQKSKGGVHRQPLYVNSNEFGNRFQGNTLNRETGDEPPPLPQKSRDACLKVAPVVPPRTDLEGIR